MDVEELDLEELFDDQAGEHGEDEVEENTEHNDAERSEAQLELDPKNEPGKGEKAPKRIIRNPQPKLDADRILGPRGVPVLQKVFEEFKPKGKGEEFRDLDFVMKKMEHWAHRLYPKLPFDDVMNRISNLGKKKTVQVNLKKIRFGMQTFIERKDSDDEAEQKLEDNDEDEVKRYDDSVPQVDADDDDELFDQLMSAPVATNVFQSQPKPSNLTDEQRERMIRNRQLAEERRKSRQANAQSSQEISTTIAAESSQEDSSLLVSHQEPENEEYFD